MPKEACFRPGSCRRHPSKLLRVQSNNPGLKKTMPEVNNKARGQKNTARGQKNKAGARKTRSGVKKIMFRWVYWGIPLLQIEQKKPACYRVCGDYGINHFWIPIKQPGFHGKYEGFQTFTWEVVASPFPSVFTNGCFVLFPVDLPVQVITLLLTWDRYPTKPWRCCAFPCCCCLVQLSH